VIARGRPALEGPGDLLGRVRPRVEELVSGYQRVSMAHDRLDAVIRFAENQARKAGLTHLPGVAGAGIREHG
jgi:hypothetical protein